MADNNVSALAAIAPVSPRGNAPQGSTQQTEQPAQPSFSQVLKSRTQSAEKPAGKPAESKPGTHAKGLQDKASEKTAEGPEEIGGGLAGELANLALLLTGEVVVVNDKFGIRLTDIITPSERVRKLRT